MGMNFRNFRRARRERDLDDEIRSHLSMAANDRMGRGESPQSARNSALREFGNVGLVAEVTRETWSRSAVEQFARDLRYGLRSLRKSPVYSAVAVLTLALGIGANSAMFSVVHGVLVTGVPYPQLDRLVFITEALPKSPINVSWPDYVDWRKQSTSFEHMAVFQSNRMYFAGTEQPRMIPGGFVSASFFPTLGAQMALGRPFSEAEDQPGAPPVTVLAYQFWRTELKADPAIIGKALWLNGVAATVVGVLSPEFRFQPWEWNALVPVSPISKQPNFVDRANHPGLAVIARMRPGVTLARSRADLGTIMDRLARDYPATNKGETAVVVPLADRLVGNVRRTLLMLLGAVGFVLLMACANVAHLALARASSRQREFAIRTALGAGRGRLIRQLSVENLLLSFLGGTAGLSLAWLAVPRVVKLYPEVVPGLADAHVDSTVLWFSLGTCVMAGLLFGLAPIVQVARSGIGGALQEGSLAAGSRRGGRLRSMLFAAEIAIAIVVSVGAGLLLRSLSAVLHVDPGFRVDHLLALNVIHAGRTGERDDIRFFAQAAERVAHQAGVKHASAVMCPPLTGTCWTSPYAADGDTEELTVQKPWTALNMVLPDYFDTMGTPLLEGRPFEVTDDKRGPHVAILNQTLARRLWPHASAVGKRLHVKYAEGDLLEVVGVVQDVRQIGLDAPAVAEVFVPAAQMPVGWMTVVARTASDPLNMARAATQAIAEVEGNQPPPKITSMTATLAETVARRKFAAFLLAMFGGLSLVLAAIGVSGVMGYTVAQRTREFGIRLAVGAGKGQVLRMVLWQGLGLASLGVAIGMGAAWELAQLLSKMLFGVTVHDPLTFGVSAALLFAVALAACFVPAWRAAGVDPMRCLRCD